MGEKKMDNLSLVFDRPAEVWNEALPLGNGSMGAMSYGKFRNEKIELNLDTLWSGTGRNKENRNTNVDWEFLRKKIFDGNYGEAEAYCKENILGDWTESYLPAGNLHIDVKVPQLKENGIYRRELSLKNAVEQVYYEQDEQRYQREFFVSMSDQVMALHYQAGEGSSLEMKISLDSQIHHCSNFETDGIVLEGRAPVYVAPPYYSCEQPIIYEDGKGIRFAIGIYVQAVGGCVRKEEDALLVTARDDVYIYLSGLTDFLQPQLYLTKRDEMLKRMRGFSYEYLKNAHQNVYTAYFDRMTLNLNSTPENDLILKMFYYARYLMISSSKPGTQCTNLQGIWNHDMRAPWSSNYTVNINTEMNYWMAEKANLSDCHEPLFELIERTARRGERTAEKVYHLNGWVSHHNLDIWGHSSPVGHLGQDENPCTYSMWPMSSGWLCSHLWEHYRYTQDEVFLREKAFPLMKGAVEFYLGFLVPYHEYLVTAPSTSPENTFTVPDQSVHCLTFGSTMDISILKELFGSYLKACEILGETDLTDKVKTALKKLPPFKIGKEGQIQEWLTDYQESDVNHRHVSHLYGLYPGNLICDEDKELLAACRTALERRGDEGTGWCMAWKACLWARIGDGEHALRLLKNQLRITREEKCSLSGGGIYPNMLCAHPPFQIDGNFGFAAAILEMLVQYQEDKIRFLPAIPLTWKNGEVKGIKAPGNITVGFTWKDGCITKFSLKSPVDTVRILLYNGTQKKVILKADKTLIDESACRILTEKFPYTF